MKTAQGMDLPGTDTMCCVFCLFFIIFQDTFPRESAAAVGGQLLDIFSGSLCEIHFFCL